MERGDLRFPVVTVAIVLVVLALQVLEPTFGLILQWEPDWLETGEVWRVVSGHLVHWSWNHFVWDLAAVAVLGAALESLFSREFVGTLILTVAFSEALLRLSGQFESYRGLSGIAMGLFGLAMLAIVRRGGGGRIAGLCGLGLLMAKTLYEMVSGETLFAEGVGSEFRVASEAHLAGILAAGVAAFPWRKLFARIRGAVGADRIAPTELGKGAS